jgi:hypothetical protein
MMISFVEIREAVRMALGSLLESKFRSFLTILGVMVGVGSVILLASIINGLNSAAEEEIDSLGTNVIHVSKFPPDVDRDDLTDEDRNRPPITVGEANAIMENCPSVSHVAPQNYYWRPGGNEAKYKGNKFSNPNLMGTWPDYTKVRDRDLAEGRFISELDQQFRSDVVVVGRVIALACRRPSTPGHFDERADEVERHSRPVDSRDDLLCGGNDRAARFDHELVDDGILDEEVPSLIRRLRVDQNHIGLNRPCHGNGLAVEWIPDFVPPLRIGELRAVDVRHR